MLQVLQHLQQRHSKDHLGGKVVAVAAVDESGRQVDHRPRLGAGLVADPAVGAVLRAAANEALGEVLVGHFGTSTSGGRISHHLHLAPAVHQLPVVVFLSLLVVVEGEEGLREIKGEEQVGDAVSRAQRLLPVVHGKGAKSGRSLLLLTTFVHMTEVKGEHHRVVPRIRAGHKEKAVTTTLLSAHHAHTGAASLEAVHQRGEDLHQQATLALEQQGAARLHAGQWLEKEDTSLDLLFVVGGGGAADEGEEEAGRRWEDGQGYRETGVMQEILKKEF